MAVATARQASGEKLDAYQLVTDRILEELEKGVVPWRKPWKGSDAPRSLASKRPYRGINTLILWLVANAEGYGSPYWATFNQIRKQGGSVRKGEKGTRVVLWKWIEKEEDGETKRIPFLRYFTVFNTDQADGLDVPVEELRDHDPVEAAEGIVAGYVNGPKVEHGKEAAYYVPQIDMVGMPNPERFESGGRYYATLFHELTHSTGHASRIDRKLSGDFGADEYSREELVAEIGSCFLLSEAGVEVEFDQSAAYVANWLERLRDDKKLVVSAAAAAQKAADLIVGRTFETEKEES